MNTSANIKTMEMNDAFATLRADLNLAEMILASQTPYIENASSSEEERVELSQTSTTLEVPATKTPPSSPSAAEKTAERANSVPHRPSAVRRLGLQHDAPQESEPSSAFDSPPTPRRPTQAARRHEMLLRTPKAPKRINPGRFAYERSLGGNRHTNNATPKKARRSVDLEIYTPERNRRAQLEQAGRCYRSM